MPFLSLGLAAAAVECRPPGLARGDDGSCAARARLAGSGIDAMKLLGRSRAPVNVDIIAKRRSALGNGALNNAMHGPAQGLKIIQGQGPSSSSGRNLSLVADLAGVNVANARDKRIVHQHGLDGFSRRVCLCQQLRWNRRGGLDSQSQALPGLVQRGACKQRDAAKAPRVVIDDGLRGAVCGLKAYPSMVVRALGMARANSNRARHSKMDHEDSASAQWQKDVAAKALGALCADARAGKALSIAGRKAVSQGVRAKLRRKDAASGHAGHLLANIFNFGKLGHGVRPIV